MMTELSQIPNLSHSSLELLDAAGFRFVEELAAANEADLTAELQRANGMLRIADEPPGQAEVETWIRHARESADFQPNAEPEPGATVPAAEKPSRVSPILPTGPFAIPLPGELLEQEGLRVSDIPEGLLISGQQSETSVDLRLPGRQSVAVHGPERKAAADLSGFRPMADVAKSLPRQPGHAEDVPDDKVALLRAPKVSTNQGVDPESRRFIRGILHSQPSRIYCGAALTVLLMVLAPLSAVASVFLLLSREAGDGFDWVPRWWLALPLSLPLLSFLWLIFGLSCACRVCGQKLFVHRGHRKNAKAHHVPLMGYILPLCVHILLFRWFRCTHCGTPVRLKP